MRRLGPAWLAGIMLGLAAEWVGFGWDDPRRWIPDLAVGWTLIGCGLIAWARRPESRTGPLMAATGFTWFLGNFAQVDVAPVAWVAIHTLYLHRGPLVHLVLTYPSGRPESPLVRGAVVVGYAVAIITPIWRSDGARSSWPRCCWPSPPANMSGRSASRRARRIALQATAGLSLVLSGTAAARLVLPQAMPVVRRCSCTRRRCACRRAAGGSADRPVAASGRCRPRRRARRGTVGHAPRRAVPGARRPNAGDRLLAVGPGCSSTPRAGCCRFPMPALGAR